MSLSGKVALVTGGTKGIGRATVIELFGRGATVIATYGRDASAAESLAAQLGNERLEVLQSDASSVEAGQQLVKHIVDKHGKIDILIPCAATMFSKDLATITPADFDHIFTTNVKGPIFLAQAAVPHIPQGGTIVLLSTSLCGMSTIAPSYLLYVATKGAIEQSLRCLAKDLGPKGIRVNAVAPGPTGTELFYQGKTEEVVKKITSLSPFDRVATPKEQAEVIVGMCEFSWVSGQVLRVNGATTVG